MAISSSVALMSASSVFSFSSSLATSSGLALSALAFSSAAAVSFCAFWRLSRPFPSHSAWIFSSACFAGAGKRERLRQREIRSELGGLRWNDAEPQTRRRGPKRTDEFWTTLFTPHYAGSFYSNRANASAPPAGNLDLLRDKLGYRRASGKGADARRRINYAVFKSGGVASWASAASASSSLAEPCSCEPSLRIDTKRSAASFLPAISSTGTLASECSRTL